jgi:hypothetical protein
MSDNILRLIPTVPDYVPDAEAQNQARKLLASHLPQAREVYIELSDTVRFVDQGGNFERVRCPVCGVTLETEWWQQAMDTAYETEFRELGITTPCCASGVSLNDLIYDWPAGFARFSLEALNPNVRDLEDKMKRKLEELLGCELRRIWTHY